MVSQIIFGALVFSAVIVFIAWLMIFLTFRNHYAGVGMTIMLSYAVFLLYMFLEIIIASQDIATSNLRLAKISSGILGLGLYLLHYFHDEISAEYRQRKTMTLGSITFGVVVGGAWVENAVKLSSEYNVAIVHPIYGLIIIGQSALLIHRLTWNSIAMGELSDHYGIKAALPNKLRPLIQRGLFIAAALSALAYIFIPNIISTPFTVIIAIFLFAVALLYYKDPLSSLPFSQPLQAIALIQEEELKYLHVFASSGESVAEGEDFAALMTALGQFFREIMKSQTRVRSISTKDVLLMFEVAGTDYLVLVLKHRAPLVRRILKSTAQTIIRKNPKTQEEFSEIVEANLLFRQSTA